MQFLFKHDTHWYIQGSLTRVSDKNFCSVDRGYHRHRATVRAAARAGGAGHCVGSWSRPHRRSRCRWGNAPARVWTLCPAAVVQTWRPLQGSAGASTSAANSARHSTGWLTTLRKSILTGGCSVIHAIEGVNGT